MRPTFDHDARSFRRGGWWQYAEAEARAIRETAGLIDASAFTKHLVRGPGATAFLDWFTCQQAAEGRRRINLTYALTERRHDADRIHHRPAGRARILPDQRRRLDGL
jgi:glycine cleavage system aminomethyltransferase T